MLQRATIPLTERLVITVDEAAALISVHPSTIRRMIRERQLQSMKRGKTRRVIVSSLREWIEENRATE